MLGLFSRRKQADVPVVVSAEEGVLAHEIGDGPYQVIRNRHHIERVLLGLANGNQSIVIGSRALSKIFETRIKAADSIAGHLLVRQLSNDNEHASLLADGYLNLSATLDGAQLLFSLNVLGTTQLDGSPCYRLPFPEWMLSVQMRDSLRISLLTHWHGTLSGALADQSVLETGIADLSEGGLGLLVKGAQAEKIAVGEELKDARIKVDSLNLDGLDLRVRHIKPVAEGDFRVGVSIETSSEAQRRELRRFILAHQRATRRVG